MSIVRGDCDERQTRADQMIDEFRQAQSRRLAKAPTVKGDDHVVELQRGAVNAQAAIAGSVPIPPSH